jgi:hypothetical protein
MVASQPPHYRDMNHLSYKYSCVPLGFLGHTGSAFDVIICLMLKYEMAMTQVHLDIIPRHACDSLGI